MRCLTDYNICVSVLNLASMLWISLVALAWFPKILFIAISFFVFFILQNKKIVKILSSDSSSNSNEQKKSVKNLQDHTKQKVTNYYSQEPKIEKTSPPMIGPTEKSKEETMICLQDRARNSNHQDAKEEVIEMIDEENEKEKSNR